MKKIGNLLNITNIAMQYNFMDIGAQIINVFYIIEKNIQRSDYFA